MRWVRERRAGCRSTRRPARYRARSRQGITLLYLLGGGVEQRRLGDRRSVHSLGSPTVGTPGTGRLSTSLSCTSPVRAGNRGTCSLSVTNTGWGTDRGVVGEVSLPRQLEADFCGHGWGWGWDNWSCSISGNTATENLGNLAAGQTKTVTVTFTARSSNPAVGRRIPVGKVARVTGSARSDQYFLGWNGNGQLPPPIRVKIVPRWYSR